MVESHPRVLSRVKAVLTPLPRKKQQKNVNQFTFWRVLLNRDCSESESDRQVANPWSRVMWFVLVLTIGSSQRFTETAFERPCDTRRITRPDISLEKFAQVLHDQFSLSMTLRTPIQTGSVPAPMDGRAALRGPLRSVDDIFYVYDESKASCLSSTPHDREFPRNLLCMSGVVLPVRDISSWLSSYGRSLCQVCIPSSIETLFGQAFYGSRSLSVVVFEYGSNVSRIERAAFGSCQLLSSICLPSSLLSLGNQCFSYCESLASVTWEPIAKIRSIGESAFIDCSSLRSLFLPSAIETLQEVWFIHCTSLVAVAFESGSRLSSMGVEVFRNCSSLSSVSIPAWVDNLGRQSFDSCRSLSAVTFESGSKLACIGDYAFYNCSLLSSICIPPSTRQLC
jgi:hypothetical protein